MLVPERGEPTTKIGLFIPSRIQLRSPGRGGSCFVPIAICRYDSCDKTATQQSAIASTVPVTRYDGSAEPLSVAIIRRAS